MDFWWQMFDVLMSPLFVCSSLLSKTNGANNRCFHSFTTTANLHLSAYYIYRTEEETKEIKLFPHLPKFIIFLRRHDTKQVFSEASLHVPTGQDWDSTEAWAPPLCPGHNPALRIISPHLPESSGQRWWTGTGESLRGAVSKYEMQKAWWEMVSSESHQTWGCLLNKWPPGK